MTTLDRLILWLGGKGTRRCGRDTGDLRRDRSGAIMVAGVFMAALLCGGLFYIIGTGDAIIYRERMQDAADAAAYTSAGIHARGMNLIVLINLIMAALLAVLVAMRMLIVMLGIAIAACLACIALSFGTCAALCSPFLAPAGNLLNSLNKAANAYEKFLNVALPALSKLELAVAMATPYVGLAKSVKVTGQYKPLVTSGFAVSPSMVPFVPDGKKLGLPVQEMDYNKFCGKAAELGVEMAFFWLPGIIKGPLQKFASFIAKTFSGYFCGDKGGNTNLKDTLANDLKGVVNSTCGQAKDDCFKEKKESSYCKDVGGGLWEFNTQNCKDDYTKKFNEANGTGQAAQSIDPKGKTPKEIWSSAEHGGLWFQVFGVTFGDEKWPRRNDKGVAIAASSGMPMPKTEWGNFRVAQAEFYWDQKGQWKDMKDECMWKMAWRARLRRFQISGLNLADAGLGKIFDLIKKPLGDKFDTLLNKFGTIDALLGKYAYDKAEDWLQDAFKGLGKPLDNKIGKWIQPSWEIIH